MKTLIRFFIILALVSAGLLYFGTHAELWTVQWVTMTVAFVLNIGALGFAFCNLPEYLPSAPDRSEQQDSKFRNSKLLNSLRDDMPY